MLNPAITKIEIYKLDLPLHTPFRIATNYRTSANNILVRIHSADGFYGLGEGSPAPYTAGEDQDISFAAAQRLARLLINQDSTQIETLHRLMEASLVRNTTTRCAIDLALHDLLAKRLGVPLYTLLGGANRPVETDMTIGIESPDVMADRAVEIQKKGFTNLKVKLGTSRLEDVARIRAIRQAVGPQMTIRLDANQGWDPAEAARILVELAPYDIQYCEQPVRAWNEAAMRRLRQLSPIPIAADETLFDHRDALRLASNETCDLFNIKLAKSSGIHNALKINAIAEGAGITCMLGCMSESRLGLTAAAHVVSARPNIAHADLDSCFFHADDPVEGGITYTGGTIHLPTAPGIGADFPQEYLDHLISAAIQ
ncbi:MAG TPA: dipeptide epimerase [Anaerolineales bacterium]|nr:dipeptide epimerase [Anaerolineales bacterium]